MDANRIKDRILDASDDDPNIHAIYKTGSDKSLDYYLVIASKQHDGMEMLKIRYFAAGQDDPGDDTWMQNGITARSSDTLITALKEDFALMDGGATKGADLTKIRDLSEELP